MEMSKNYLAHHGIKGQKWGIRRYQNADGSLTSEGRKRRGLSADSGIQKLIDKRKEKSAAKKEASAANRHENLKEYVRDHPKSLYRNRREFSNQEINELVQTINMDQRLKDIHDAEVQRSWKNVQAFSDNMGKVKSLIQNGKDLYNLGVEITNTMIDSGKMQGTKRLKIGEKPEEKKDTSAMDAIVKSNYNSKTIADNLQNLSTKDLENAIKGHKYYEQLVKDMADSKKAEPTKSAADIANEIVSDLKMPSGWYSPRDADWYKPLDDIVHGLDVSVNDIYTEDADEDYLEHFGILGMKWGVRRFQNEDGTLTEAGKARYAKQLSDDVKKADSANNASLTSSKVRTALEKNKAVKQFEETNKTGYDLRRAHSDINEINERINLQVNKELEKKYGKFMSLTFEDQAKYYGEGMQMFKERASKEDYEDLVSKYKKLSAQYEKESRDFLDDLLGKYGDEELRSDWAIKYNFETKEFSKQTVKDLAGIEMLRRSGGFI